MATKTEDWTINIQLKQLQNAPLAKTFNDLPARCWALVGSSQDNGRLCLYRKRGTEGDDLIPERYSQGIFLELGGEMQYWDAAQVFAQDGIKVWCMAPKAITAIGDDRPMLDGE